MMRPYLFFAALLLIGCTNQPEQTNATPKTDQTPVVEQKKEQPKVEPKPQPPIEIRSAPNLWKSYCDNEVAADLQYTGKTIQTVMMAEQIGKDQSGYFVRFHCYDAPGRDDALVVYFQPEHAKMLANLKRNDFLLFTAKCQGKRTNPLFFDSCEVVLTDGIPNQAMTLNEMRTWLRPG